MKNVIKQDSSGTYIVSRIVGVGIENKKNGRFVPSEKMVEKNSSEA